MENANLPAVGGRAEHTVAIDQSSAPQTNLEQSSRYGSPQHHTTEVPSPGRAPRARAHPGTYSADSRTFDPGVCDHGQRSIPFARTRTSQSCACPRDPLASRHSSSAARFGASAHTDRTSLERTPDAQSTSSNTVPPSLDTSTAGLPYNCDNRTASDHSETGNDSRPERTTRYCASERRVACALPEPSTGYVDNKGPGTDEKLIVTYADQVRRRSAQPCSASDTQPERQSPSPTARDITMSVGVASSARLDHTPEDTEITLPSPLALPPTTTNAQDEVLHTEREARGDQRQPNSLPRAACQAHEPKTALAEHEVRSVRNRGLPKRGDETQSPACVHTACASCTSEHCEQRAQQRNQTVHSMSGSRCQLHANSRSDDLELPITTCHGECCTRRSAGLPPSRDGCGSSSSAPQCQALEDSRNNQNHALQAELAQAGLPPESSDSMQPRCSPASAEPQSPASPQISANSVASDSDESAQWHEANNQGFSECPPADDRPPPGAEVPFLDEQNDLEDAGNGADSTSQAREASAGSSEHSRNVGSALAATLDRNQPLSHGETNPAPKLGLHNDKMNDAQLKAQIRAINADSSLNEQEKAVRRQSLFSGHVDKQVEAAAAARLEKLNEEAKKRTYSKVRDPSSPSDFLPGCEHYPRRCKIKAACCDRWVGCRLCHDDPKLNLDHNIDRFATREILCMECGMEQPVAEFCAGCGVQFARHFCPICKFYDDTPGKDIYHCDKCGICRVGKGLGIDNFHCNTCQSCVSLESKEVHVCVENSLQANCPICKVYLYTSLEPAVYMRCGHTMHSSCTFRLLFPAQRTQPVLP